MCLLLAVCFLISALLFALGKEKAADWLSGFHGLPEEERAKYDRKRMAEDERKHFLLWGLIMLAGAGGAQWISGWCAAAAYVIWMILFFKDVHLDMDKAFGKYKL